MLSEIDRHIAREFLRRLTAIVPVLDLRIFGSRVRGEATEESDLDVSSSWRALHLHYVNAFMRPPRK